MSTRTKVPMSKPRSALPRVALLALALASLTCSDDATGFGNGRISGTVYLAEPVEGATVTVNRWDGGVVGAEVCRGTTDAAGGYECASGKYFGVMLVTATGGHTVEQGAALTLPAGSVLRAPLLDLQPQQQRSIHLNPATELIVALGTARAAAGQDADLVAAVTHAHALLRAHFDADPVTVAPKSVDATTAFDEPARVALVLRGLGEAAHLAAVDQAVTVQAINTRALLDQLVKDAASAEARLDGNGAEVLSVGPSCGLPTNCTVEGPGCYSACSVHTSSLRGRLANATIAWLGTPANRTGLAADDILTWATALTTNTDDQLFGPEPPEDADSLGPTLSWAAPAAGQVFTSGTIMIDVTAADPLGVATLGVDHLVGQTRTPIADTDPTPERFVGALPLTPTLAEGTLTLEAHATDRDTNPTTETREVSINQLTGGAISGVAIKAALASAPVTVRTFTNAAPGATILATGTTDPAGNFINLAIPEGTQGDLLLEVGGAGTYAEDAQPATVVSLAATEKLSVVLPGYTDGDTIAGLVVSPATTLAVAYTTYLQGANQGGATVAAKWATAVAALERHTGVTGLTTVVPSVPSQIDTLDDADRYGLVLLALSRTAWQASALGGGDAGAFGSAVNAMKVLQVWVRDLGDGCWDGRAGRHRALSYGGPTLLTDEATRVQLAQALVAYLGSAQNQTQFAVPADVLPLLDTWSTGGGNTAPGACAGTNHLFDDAGQGFDREGPVITWGAFPATDPFVRGSVTVTATAVDNLPTLPGLVFTTGQTDIDVADERRARRPRHHRHERPGAARGARDRRLGQRDPRRARSDRRQPRAGDLDHRAGDGRAVPPPAGHARLERGGGQPDGDHRDPRRRARRSRPASRSPRRALTRSAVTAVDRAGGTEHRDAHVHDRRRRSRARQRERAERRRREAAAHDHGDRHRQLHGDGLAGSGHHGHQHAGADDHDAGHDGRQPHARRDLRHARRRPVHGTLRSGRPRRQHHDAHRRQDHRRHRAHARLEHRRPDARGQRLLDRDRHARLDRDRRRREPRDRDRVVAWRQRRPPPSLAAPGRPPCRPPPGSASAA
jgi:hypothetical protein